MLAMETPKLNTAVVHDFVCSLNKTTSKSMVRVINKLVRKIKSYKDKENEKLVRKAERLVEELQVLKKTHAKEASIFALKNFKTIGEVMSVQRRALIRVASETLLAAKIKDFRIKYPNWKTELPSILSMLGKKWKKNNKIKERIEKSMAKKNKIGVSEKNSLSKEKNKSKKQDPLPHNESLELEIKNKGESSEEEEEMEVESPLAIERKEGDLVIKKINLNELSSDEEQEESENFLHTPLSEGSRKIKDSFFLGGSDDNDSQEEEDEEEESFSERDSVPESKQFLKFNNRFSRRNPGSVNKFSGSSKGFQGGKKNFHEKIHPSWEAKRNERQLARPMGKKTFFGDHEGLKSKKQDLHPSWAAKKEANKSSIHEFKGKRTVFGEKEDANKESYKDLHPSWAAKKEANKSSIQEFKGTKIVFDD